jgi:hypothetical protein
MLKSTFKPCRELGLSYDDYVALIVTLRELEGGRLKQRRWYTNLLPWNAGEYFDMRVYERVNTFGTRYYCIAGLAMKLCRVQNIAVGGNLFFPWHGNGKRKAYTPQEAATVLRNFLEKGIVDWSVV